MSEYHDIKADERFNEMESRLYNITQVPIGSSKKDFKITPARSLINNKRFIEQCHTPDTRPR